MMMIIIIITIIINKLENQGIDLVREVGSVDVANQTLNPRLKRWLQFSV